MLEVLLSQELSIWSLLYSVRCEKLMLGYGQVSALSGLLQGVVSWETQRGW